MQKINSMSTIETLKYLYSIRHYDNEVLFGKVKMFGACLNSFGKERYGYCDRCEIARLCQAWNEWHTKTYEREYFNAQVCYIQFVHELEKVVESMG